MRTEKSVDKGERVKSLRTQNGSCELNSPLLAWFEYWLTMELQKDLANRICDLKKLRCATCDLQHWDWGNNRVNNLITTSLDLSDEEVLAYYVALLKSLAVRLDSETIKFYFLAAPSTSKGGAGALKLAFSKPPAGSPDPEDPPPSQTMSTASRNFLQSPN